DYYCQVWGISSDYWEF
nr:immunoglobulin light chain junction region [Macaca mulatta]MOX32774.1 immunoglobulin light chain junction region [Macaca mulatta]